MFDEFRRMINPVESVAPALGLSQRFDSSVDVYFGRRSERAEHVAGASGYGSSPNAHVLLRMVDKAACFGVVDCFMSRAACALAASRSSSEG